jgi:hypothetical protein
MPSNKFISSDRFIPAENTLASHPVTASFIFSIVFGLQ